MAELRLTGPTEGGDALSLTSPDGSAHTLPVTPYLRRLVVDQGEAATPEDPAPDAAPQDPADDAERPEPAVPVTPVADQADVRAAATADAVPLSPREIQTRIRAGATVEQVARESGNAFSRIRTYGFPVLAERGYIAQQAQGVEVWVGGPDLYSSTVTDGGPTTLAELAAHRLAELGADVAALEWDAWRAGAGDWTVVATFPVPEGTALPTGEQPPARWSFRPTGRHLDPQNAWARILSDAEAWDVRHPAADGGPAADVAHPLPAEEDGVSAAAVDAGQDAVTPRGAVSASADRDADLLEILRVRRGRRVGQDEESDEALAHLIAREAQAREAAGHTEEETAHPSPATPGREPAEEAADAPAPSRAARLLRGLPALPEDDAEADVQADRPDDGPEAAPSTAPDAGADEDPAAEPTTRPGRERPAMPTPRPRARSAARRASVPSWDDIVFGRKGD